MSSSIMAQLDLDEARFSSGLTRAEKRYEMFGEKVNSMNFDRGAKNFNKAFGVGGDAGGGAGGSSPGPHGHSLGQTLNRDFGVGPSVRTLLLFGATNSAVEKVVEKIAGLWKEAAESAKRIAEFSEKSYAATLKTIGLRQTDEQKLFGLRKADAKARKELDQINMFSRAGVSTDKDKERAAELAKDINERGADEQELINKIAEKKRKVFADDMERANKINEEKNKGNYENLTLEQKIAEQKRRAAEFDRRANSTAGSARSENELKAEEAITEQKRLQAELDKQKLDTANKIDDALTKFFGDVERGSKQAEAHRQREIKARLALGQAETNLAEARADRSHITLGDAVSGKRGTPTEQAQARRISQLEKEAQNVRDHGGDFRAANGKTISADARAQQLFDRAGELRKNMSGLDRNDREPFRSLEKAVEDSKAVLEQIRDNLEPDGG